MIRVFDEEFKEFTNLAITPPSDTWSATNGTIGGSSLYATITGDGTALNPRMYSAETACIVGHKYYVKIRAKVDNAVCASMRFIYGSVSATLITTPAIETVYDRSAIVTATSTSQFIYIYHYYADAATSNLKVMTVYDVVIIDLTTAYGAGSEPTVDAMDGVKSMWSLKNSPGIATTITSNNFNSNGEKIIQPTKCVEILEDNVDWRVEVTADISYQPYLLQDRILVVQTKENGEQPFRIANIRVDNYEVSFKARHIGFDLYNYASTFLFGFAYNSNTRSLMTVAIDSSTPEPQFTISSDSVLHGRVEFKGGSILENFYEITKTLGGHITFNWWNVDLSSTVGTDHGVTIEYGKNLQGAEITEDWGSVCTRIIPIGNNNLLLNGTKYVLNGTYYLDATGVSYDRPYTRKVTFQTDDVVELEAYANAYLEQYKVPKLNYKVQADTVQDVGLGDTIYVYSKQFTISTNVLGYKFNVNTQKIIDVEFGNFRKDVKTVFGNIQANMEELKKSVVQENITMNASLGLSILAYKSTATTINGSGTNGGVTKYVLDTALHNTDTTWFELTGGSVKVLKAGVYMITAMTSITSGTAGQRINALITVNSGTANNLSTIGQVASMACRANGTIVLNLAANDIIDLSIYNSDSATKTTTGGTDYNYLAVTRQ